MPIVFVYMLEGRGLEQKRSMVKGITDAIVSSLGVKPEQVRVVVREIRKEDLWVAGEPRA